MLNLSAEDVYIFALNQIIPFPAAFQTIQRELALSNVPQLQTTSLIILLADVFFIVLELSMTRLLLLITLQEDVLMYVLPPLIFSEIHQLYAVCQYVRSPKKPMLIIILDAVSRSAQLPLILLSMQITSLKDVCQVTL
jgi:hypothetical protein